MTNLVMPGWVPCRAWGNADHIPGILKAHDALLELDFDTYDQVATRVTARLVAKWKDTLAGADTFTHDTVSAAIVSLSTDAPKIPPESLK
jgi:hypothetical protein